ncbi:MAG: hypothetical protein BWX48_02028 [Verrucomicrobia bacterium ADurb.Bin006]|nr:MAG: hypothetical protein BWX48_02028 [Verrucomicrobia bacterium ADurb.Bin006]
MIGAAALTGRQNPDNCRMRRTALRPSVRAGGPERVMLSLVR